MNRPRHQFFTGAGFPADQHVGKTVGDRLDQFEDVTHLVVLADDPVKPIRRRAQHPLLMRIQLVRRDHQLGLLLGHLLHRATNQVQRLAVNRFFEVIHHPDPHRRDRLGHGRFPRADQDTDRWMHLAHLFDKLQTVMGRLVNLCYQDPHAARFQENQRILGPGSRQNLEMPPNQFVGKSKRPGRISVEQQYLGFGHVQHCSPVSNHMEHHPRQPEPIRHRETEQHEHVNRTKSA